MAPLLAALIPVLSSVLDRVLPDEQARNEAKQQTTLALLQSSNELDRAAADIIRAEAQGEGWLQRSWRPILMLTFAGLIVARWFGFAAPNLSEAEYLKLWGIVEVGLGGYVIGRSAEKIIPSVADIMKR